MKISTLKPGLLVSLKTSLVGNITYVSKIIESEHKETDGSTRERWETERIVPDLEERKRADQTREKCRSLVGRICCQSAFGLLCPEDKKSELDAAVREAIELAGAFNETAQLTCVTVHVIAGRIAPDDVEAIRAINSEMLDLLADMESGLKRLDVDAVRQAASRAKSVGRMLSPEAEARIGRAVNAARSMARKIVKAGEEVAVVVDHEVLKQIAESRTAFLDLEEGEEVEAPGAEARAIDLEPEGPETPPTDEAPARGAGASAPQIELED
jgi:hypothetical protein